ncbi:MarR family transcriptional regulator [Halobacteriales archaeon QS_8_65_32]|jgi:predicted transcriptional regulator|nr:MAG: MarR family transcriptional regulator [Halobacteriales archaeon QS_8_65_32]
MPGEEVDRTKRATLRRFAAFGAAGSLARLADGDEKDDTGETSSDARDGIAGYVAATPGAHFSKVRDDLSLGTGETQYHIEKLVDAGAIESRRDGDYRRYFPAKRFSPFEQRALGYLRRDTARGMVLALLETPDVSASELADHLGVSRPTVSKYASELESAGVLSRTDGYALRRPETLLVLLVRYADSFNEDTAAFAANADDLVQFDP